MEILLGLLVMVGLGALVGGGSGSDDVPDTPPETPDATDGDDTVVLSASGDVFDALGGDNSIDGASGDDTLSGNDGADTLTGGNGDDDLAGGAGEDYVYGGAGQDYLEGGDGKDRMAGGDGNDFLEGNDGNDRLYGNGGNDIILGGDNASGTKDFLYGGDDNDLIIGGSGADYVYGGAGEDILIGSNVVTLSPEALALQRGDITTLSQPITAIEEERGVDPAKDTIYGGDGDDLILLGGGDTAEGGDGDDAFIVGVDWIGAEHVRINDFTPDEDVIIIGYDADDGPPVISYEQASDGRVDVYANDEYVARIQSGSVGGDLIGLSVNDVDAALIAREINPADGL